MKKLMLLAACLVLALALLTGCGGLKPEDLGRVTISLSGEPEGEHQWRYEIMEPVIFKEESNAYEERGGESESTVAGGTYSWTFVPEKYGRTDIVFTCANPETPEEEALYTVTYTLSSDKSGQLKFEGSSGNYPDSTVPQIVNRARE